MEQLWSRSIIQRNRVPLVIGSIKWTAEVADCIGSAWPTLLVKERMSGQMECKLLIFHGKLFSLSTFQLWKIIKKMFNRYSGEPNDSDGSSDCIHMVRSCNCPMFHPNSFDIYVLFLGVWKQKPTMDRFRMLQQKHLCLLSKIKYNSENCEACRSLVWYLIMLTFR